MLYLQGIYFYLKFHHLQGVIAPGAYGSYGPDLPYFHVTEYGMQCIKQVHILPYNPDGYLKKLKKIDDINDWVVFYVTEGLRCFNTNRINSSMINIALAGEIVPRTPPIKPRTLNKEPSGKCRIF